MVLAMIFLTLFTCMAVALVASADTNTTIARNRIESHQANALAESGLLMIEQCLSGLSVPGTHDVGDLHEAIAEHLEDFWVNSDMLDASDIRWSSSAVDLPPITFTRPDGRQGTLTQSISPRPSSV